MGGPARRLAGGPVRRLAGGPSIRRQSQCVVVARGEPGTSGAGGPMAGWFHWVDWRKVVLEPPLGWDGRQGARNGSQGKPGGATPRGLRLPVRARRPNGRRARGERGLGPAGRAAAPATGPAPGVPPLPANGRSPDNVGRAGKKMTAEKGEIPFSPARLAQQGLCFSAPSGKTLHCHSVFTAFPTGRKGERFFRDLLGIRH